MVKKVLFCALSIAILLPLFTFSVFAEGNFVLDAFANPDGTFIGPIPELYYNRKYGTNLNWWYLTHQSNVDVGLSMEGDFSPEDQEFWGTEYTGTDRITLATFKVDELTGTSVVEFSIDFSSHEQYGKIFDLSSRGYVQFWWQMAFKGVTESGGSPNPIKVNVQLYGDSTAFLDPDGDGYGQSGYPNLYEYVRLDRDPLPVGYSLSEGNRFQYFWGATYGATLTSSVMRSKYINRIHISIEFASPVSECYLCLSDINYRSYDATGASMDSAYAPPLSPGDMESADTEGDIQTSIDKGIDATQELINNRFDELRNDDMGYIKPSNPEMDQGLDSGNSLLDTMDQALSDFDRTLDDSFTTFRAWMQRYSDVINTFWDGIPTMVTAVVTATVMFLVIRKVVGR